MATAAGAVGSFAGAAGGFSCGVAPRTGGQRSRASCRRCGRSATTASPRAPAAALCEVGVGGSSEAGGRQVRHATGRRGRDDRIVGCMTVHSYLNAGQHGQHQVTLREEVKRWRQTEPSLQHCRVRREREVSPPTTSSDLGVGGICRGMMKAVRALHVAPAVLLCLTSRHL